MSEDISQSVLDCYDFVSDLLRRKYAMHASTNNDEVDAEVPRGPTLKRSLSYTRPEKHTRMAKKPRTWWWPFGSSEESTPLPVPVPVPQPFDSLDTLLARGTPPDLNPTIFCGISMASRSALHAVIALLQTAEDRDDVDVSSHPVYKMLVTWQAHLKSWDELHVTVNRVHENAVALYREDTLEKWLADLLADLTTYCVAK
jgi:hypothetical protein